MEDKESDSKVKHSRYEEGGSDKRFGGRTGEVGRFPKETEAQQMRLICAAGRSY